MARKKKIDRVDTDEQMEQAKERFLAFCMDWLMRHIRDGAFDAAEGRAFIRSAPYLEQAKAFANIHFISLVATLSENLKFEIRDEQA